MSPTGDFIFYFLGASAIILALLTVGSIYILRSVVYLMGVLCVSAGFYFLLGADFLAGTQILVYVGGIVVLLVFAVMLTRSEDLEQDRASGLRKLLGLVASAGFFVSSFLILKDTPLMEERALAPSTAGIREIGLGLLSTGANGYVLPFEVISLLLLTVLVAGIVIARKEAQ